jgi:hypothetical protein
MEGRRNTRLAESRANEQLKQYNMEYISPLALPHGVARDGYKYCWANREVPHQIENMVRQGWEIVPSDRCPSYSVDPLKRNENMSNYIWYMDALLMEIPDYLAQKVAAYKQARTDNAVGTLEGVTTDFMAPVRHINSFV